MDSSVSQKDQFWFLRVCLHVPIQLYQYAAVRIMARKVADNTVHEGKFVFRFHLHEIDVSEIRELKSCVIMNKEPSNIF